MSQHDQTNLEPGSISIHVSAARRGRLRAGLAALNDPETVMCEWSPAERLADGRIVMGYPTYSAQFHRLTNELWKLAQDSATSSPRSSDGAHIATFVSIDSVSQAGAEQVLGWVRWFVSGERFSDGSWEGPIGSGVLATVVQRVLVLGEADPA